MFEALNKITIVRHDHVVYKKRCQILILNVFHQTCFHEYSINPSICISLIKFVQLFLTLVVSLHTIIKRCHFTY